MRTGFDIFSTIYSPASHGPFHDFNRLLYIGEASLGGGVPNGGWYSLNPDAVAFFENYSQYTDYFLTINVYDTLSTAFMNEFSPPEDYYNTINYTKGNLIATAYRTSGTDEWNYKYYRYDLRGRVIRMWHEIDGLETKTIDYTYNSQNQVTHLSYQNGVEEEFKKFRYVYDKAGRLKDVLVFEPPPSEDYHNFTSYEYNQNSQVSRHSLNDDMIHTKYGYNSRNWIVLTSENDIFRYGLNYFKNGNVMSQHFAGDYPQNFINQSNLSITYTYDPSNRLLKADAGATNSTFDLENTYDYDGNIKTLMRYGSSNNLLDDFNYEYITGTNKLRKVSGTIDQFTYDYNGNMKGDELQHNYGLKYDHRNLLIEISRIISENETEVTRYYYDEAGNRIRKLILRHWAGGGGEPDPPVWDDIGSLPNYQPDGGGGDGWSIYKNEYYVRGVGGNTIAEYEWETLQQWNVWGTDNVGKIVKEDTEENKYYYLKDHLGSIRAVIDEDNSCVSAQDYDMWGFLLQNRTFNIDETEYKFTGKERDIESSYDYFGARYYMSRIGRWGSVEPLMEKYISFSPYQYGLLNPMKFVDVNGEVLILGGDQTMALDDILSLLPVSEQERISVTDEGVVEFNIEGLDLESDAAYELIHNIVKAEEKILYEVADITTGIARISSGEIKAGTEITIDLLKRSGTSNLSKTERYIGTNIKGGPGHLPKYGYSGQVTLGTGNWTIPNVIGSDVFLPRSDIVFHELAENYYRTVKKEPYMRRDESGAHQSAVEAAYHFKKQSIHKPGEVGRYVQ